ncbi:hypothetical protein FRC10_008616 [Ceratobasidium sp. 414]|nr:hypothetical protein FRC10_008616 [Ceratobasidium sp. 414]
MPGFSVSVFDDTTGAPIPQVGASDGGGLINGRAFSAPNLIWAISAAVIGAPLSVAGVKLWRITTALGVGLSLAFAMWAALVNALSETGLASSQSMSDMLILLITGAAFLVGAIGGAFRIVVLPAMGASCAIGGASITTRIVILRPGLLVPSGLNDQLAFVNIVIVAVGALCGGLSVVFKQRGSMIFATASIGSFLIALTVDLLVNGQSGMSRGLRSLFDMNDNHLADLVGGGYKPPLSSQIIVACSLGLMCVFPKYFDLRAQLMFLHYIFPGPFIQPRARDRTQSIPGIMRTDHVTLPTTDSPPNEKQPLAPVNQGPTVRNSVLSIFHAPGRPSNAGSSRFSISDWIGIAKPANERRGSTAYNYGAGAFALPSEIMRQKPRRNALPAQPVRQPPPPRQLQLSAPRRDGASVGVQRPLPVQREGSARPNFPTYGYGYARGPRLGPPVGVAATYPIGVPGPTALVRTATVPIQPLRLDASLPTPARADGQNGKALARGPGLPSTPRTPQPAATTPTRPVPSPTVDFEPASTPRMGIGLGMLRLSADSIIDAYGGMEDNGYRYGGSRTGQAVSLLYSCVIANDWLNLMVDDIGKNMIGLVCVLYFVSGYNIGA